MPELPRYNNYPVPKKVEDHYRGRIRQFTDPNGHFRDLNLPAFYDRERTSSEDNVKISVYSVPDLKRPSFDWAMKHAEWRPAHKGDRFGPSWSTHWFKIQVCVPKSWADHKERALFEWDSSDEGFLYSEQGKPIVGLSGEHNRKEHVLPKDWQYGEWYTFYIETGCNDIGGNYSPPNPDRTFELRRADLVVPREAARALYIDFWVLGDACREFPGNSWQQHKALDVCNRIINAFDRNDVDNSLVKCREIAAEYLGKMEPEPEQAKAEQAKPSAGDAAVVVAIGNCHIDTAWLWPYAETRRKIARSWASQLELLDKYPDYIFAASQMLQFHWLKEDHPELFKRVQAAVKKGRFIPIGGSWVECDANMPSGESFARQLFLGQRFMEKEFGFKSRTFWLPDTFGYAPQLPQILRLAGMDRFLTQKLSWNNINVFPNSTFNWVGLDGSQVVCHMPPANTYTADAHFGDVKRSMEQHKNLDVDQHSMMLFGYGDGGGGPTAEMLEKLKRCEGLSETVGLLPKVEQGVTVDEFFDRVGNNTDNFSKLVSWKGELYLEYHRGTYTTQAAIKAYNRRCEALLRNLEIVASSAVLKSSNYSYPASEIYELWQDVCLNQFHDVLPGSGIEMIYVDARAIYQNVVHKAEKLLGKALEAAKSPAGVLLLPDEYVIPEPTEIKQLDDFYVFENKFLRVTFKGADLYSVFDKQAHREVMLEYQANKLLLFEDQPMNFQAWDTDQYATEKCVELHAHKVEATKHEHIAHFKFNKSTATMRTTLKGDMLVFDLDVDWHETYQFLKTEFPVNVLADFASYETAFGHHRRPTHFNTSWDAAKFEVCGHRWADLSDYNYGVSLINNSKYGYSIHGKYMRLSLLRSPKTPDANADMGKHSISYALYPHQGPLGTATIDRAEAFNSFFPCNGPRTNSSLCPVRITGVDGKRSTVYLSAFKLAEHQEQSDSTVVVATRLYEALGGQANIVLNSIYKVEQANLANILEEPLRKLDTHAGPEHDGVALHFEPFQVQTILLKLRKQI